VTSRIGRVSEARPSDGDARIASVAIVLLGGVALLVVVTRLARTRALSPTIAAVGQIGADRRHSQTAASPGLRLGLALGVTMVLWSTSLVVLSEWYFSARSNSLDLEPDQGFWTSRDLAQFVCGSLPCVASGPTAWWIGGRRGLLVLSALAAAVLVLVRSSPAP
jgi:hypothetical protein